MLCEQIEKEKVKIPCEGFLLTDAETEISFWTPIKMRGLELTSEGGKCTSYSGTGIEKIQDGKVSSKRDTIYFQTKGYTRRWH